uniref:Macaca fascicularis brain cDNA clone: QorA-10602, similar to human steroid sensitive gene 1 (URB), transcript variant 1, mRNA, RefSeq: NM_199511.1 n=1 Tax=Macaca fascicularis TaxID=9541 RepID=I7G949_MACFA|nr:unnamed protein product [Macaca fascicularis]
MRGPQLGQECCVSLRDPALPTSLPALQGRTECGSSQPLMPRKATTAS